MGSALPVLGRFSEVQQSLIWCPNGGGLRPVAFWARKTRSSEGPAAKGFEGGQPGPSTSGVAYYFDCVRRFFALGGGQADPRWKEAYDRGATSF